MKSEDFELHETVLRHLKGVVRAYQKWLELKKAEVTHTTPQARNSRPVQKSEQRDEC